MELFHQCGGVIAFICQNELGIIILDKGLSLAHVVALARRQEKPQRVTQGINRDMNFSRKPSTTST